MRLMFEIFNEFGLVARLCTFHCALRKCNLAKGQTESERGTEKSFASSFLFPLFCHSTLNVCLTVFCRLFRCVPRSDAPRDGNWIMESEAEGSKGTPIENSSSTPPPYFYSDLAEGVERFQSFMLGIIEGRALLMDFRQDSERQNGINNLCKANSLWSSML